MSEPTHEVRAEFDRLMALAENYASHFNLAAVSVYLLEHPEIVNRPLCAAVKGDHEHRARRASRQEGR
jgi:hypothetical protein